MAEQVVAWVARVLFDDTIVLMFVMFAMLGIAEYFCPAIKVPRAHYKLNIGFSILTMWLAVALVSLMSVGIVTVVQRLGGPFIDLRNYGISGLGGALLALLIASLLHDFFFYWMHRFQHANQVMWQEHLVHHSDEHMNVTTATRAHFLDGLIAPLFITLPVSLLFDLPPVTIGALSLIPLAWHYITHANVNVSYGPLWWLLVSPNYHRIHHSLDRRHIDKNFAAWFPVWDILFGTLYRPEKGPVPATGVAGVHVASVREALLLPFRNWGRMLTGQLRRAGEPVQQ